MRKNLPNHKTKMACLIGTRFAGSPVRGYLPFPRHFYFDAKKYAPRNTGRIPKYLLESRCDNCHLVNLFRIAAAGQVVDWCVQTLKDRTKCLNSTQTLCNLIADVAGIDIWEDEGVCMTCNSRAPYLVSATTGENAASN